MCMAGITNTPLETTSSPALGGESTRRPGRFFLLLTAAVLGLAAVAGGVWLAHSGRAAKWCKRPAILTAKAQPAMATHIVTLEPFLVNLADSGGQSYLRVAMVLRVQDAAGTVKAEAGAKDDAAASEEKAAARDTILAELSRMSAEELLAADGQQQMKQRVKTALAARTPAIVASEIYLTDFLVQRG
jgi:flagellar FliL protein